MADPVDFWTPIAPMQGTSLISGQGTGILVAAGMAKKIVIIKMKCIRDAIERWPVLNELSKQRTRR